MHKFYLAVQYASNAPNLPTRAQLRRWVKIALQHDASITLRIVDEPEGRELNKNFRGKDYATNVLTFVYDDAKATPNPSRPPLVRGGVTLHPDTGRAGEGFASQPLHGDIVICAPVVAREAREQHKDMQAHYAHLTLHATLHLQGYDHEQDAAAATMETLESALMLKLRFPDPYLAI